MDDDASSESGESGNNSDASVSDGETEDEEVAEATSSGYV